MTVEELFTNEEVKKEYKKAMLLNMFKKIVVKMNKNDSFKQSIKKLFIQSTDRMITVRAIIRNNYNYELSEDDSKLMLKWFEANLKKNGRRKSFSLEYKKKLYTNQNGICPICGEPLGTDLSKIHVDHIIPWMLVGDELKDNYQCLCETCNECKSAHIDYVFKNLIKLN